VITGEIADLEAEFDLERPPVVTVTGYDFRWRLGRNRIYQTYPNRTDSAIASDVISRNHLTPDITPTTITHELVTQDYETDLDFLHQCAERNRFDVTIEGSRVIFGPPRDPVTVPLLFGQELLGFSPSIAGSRLVGQVDAYGYDILQSSQPELSVSAKALRFPG